jgi:hypothetical protein
MADVKTFFTTYLPEKLAANPSIGSSINAVYQFNLGTAGSYTVDLTKEGGEITEGIHAAPGCVVTASGEDFQKVLDNPSAALTMFAMGKLKVSNVPLGMSLQKLLN